MRVLAKLAPSRRLWTVEDRELCNEVVRDPQYEGARHSDSNGFIADKEQVVHGTNCAVCEDGVGNLRSLRADGTNTPHVALQRRFSISAQLGLSTVVQKNAFSNIYGFILGCDTITDGFHLDDGSAAPREPAVRLARPENQQRLEERFVALEDMPPPDDEVYGSTTSVINSRGGTTKSYVIKKPCLSRLRPRGRPPLLAVEGEVTQPATRISSPVLGQLNRVRVALVLEGLQDAAGQRQAQDDVETKLQQRRATVSEHDELGAQPAAQPAASRRDRWLMYLRDVGEVRIDAVRDVKVENLAGETEIGAGEINIASRLALAPQGHAVPARHGTGSMNGVVSDAYQGSCGRGKSDLYLIPVLHGVNALPAESPLAVAVWDERMPLVDATITIRHPDESNAGAKDHTARPHLMCAHPPADRHHSLLAM
ncbi:hypothetical protein H9P43_006605 [Blastocladiella emersonii ATCC 22665]|nr:hypothetical protein H9P43_006605 [Blastocladiella emersonii ATCC 22665]